MKILTNKKYNELIDSIEICHQVINAKETTIIKTNNRNEELLNKYTRLENNFKIIGKAYIKKFNEWLNVKKELTNIKKAKGGYNKQINRLQNKVNQLQKELEETNQKLKESMTDKYLVKKIPSGKRPKTIFTKINNSSVQSNIVKNMYKEG